MRVTCRLKGGSKIKLLLIVFCVLFPFKAVSGLNINIYKGVELSSEASIDKDGYPTEDNNVRLEADEHFPEHFKDMKDGVYKYNKNADYYLSYSGYMEFRKFLINLRSIRGFSSSAGRKLLVAEQLFEQRFSRPWQTHGSSGLSAPLLMSDVFLQYSPSSSGASNIVEQTPFEDLISFNDHNGPIGPDACRRLRRDFIDFLELAKASSCDGYLIETFIFFFENLQNADTEATVINLG